MRRVAHELAVLEEQNRNFRDGAIFRLLRHETEFVIQDVGRTNWTVERSRRDLRGKTSRCDRNRHIDGHLQRALSQRVSAIDDVSLDGRQP
jgi:hypothetical protein